MLHVKGLTKKFGKQIVNRDISLECKEGEISILLGPNGAGKSTAIKCILGLLRHEGEVTIGGHPSKSGEAKRIFGYVPEYPCLYEMLTMEEQFEFIIRAYKLDREQAMADVDDLVGRFRLTERRKHLCKDLSKGMQQKVSIICALLPHPKLLLLDEPMIGLDPHAIKELKNLILILAKKRGVAIVISTHMIASVEGIWDKAYILSRGRVLSCHTKEEVSGLGVDALEKIFFEETEKPELLAPRTEEEKSGKNKKQAKAEKAASEEKEKKSSHVTPAPPPKKDKKKKEPAPSVPETKKEIVDDPDLAPADEHVQEKHRVAPPPKKKGKKKHS
ncbi:MAG: ABC transporter ATP-binding protein [Clostridiales bacterium]|nr:ABC transporter ATP-binding protein [Clostridiales bacterium]